MKKKFKLILILFLFLSININVLAEVPEKPPGEDNGGPGETKEEITYDGVIVFTKDTESNDQTFSSEQGKQNVLLVSGGNSTIKSCTITKTGDDSGDSSDFYGTNAAIFTYNNATLNIFNSNISTNGSHANAVFAYDSGIINITNSTIKTSNNNSGAIMVTGGGALSATNVTAETDGNSSAPIRSDRGGGSITVNKGSYTSHGVGSPVIYSTAKIKVNEATLTSTASEGVVIEGKNSVDLDNVTLEVTNNKLNGNSETYKSIFIYQSMSGDAEVGSSSFSSKDSKIINNKGDIIFVTNTKTTIDLENNDITNNDTDGAFLRISSAKWGETGSNGGDVKLNFTNQKAFGDILIDSISSLTLNMKDNSILVGSINKDNQSENVSLLLSSDSIISLTEDTYITSLKNDNKNNSNIYSNGKYKLYVNNKEVEINSDTFDISTVKETKTTTNDKKANNDNTTNSILLYAVAGGAATLIIIIIVVVILIKRNKNKEDL